MTLVPDPSFAFAPLLEAALRSTVLIAFAALVALALRRAPAAVRHLVWTLAIVGSVAMPLAARVVPGWSLPGLTAWSARLEPTLSLAAGAAGSPAAGALQTRSQPLDAVSVDRTQPSRAAAPVDRAQPSRAATAWRPSVADVVRLLPLVWLAGAMLLLARYLVGWIRITRLAHRAAPMEDHAWQVALAKHGATLRLRRLPSLRVSPRVVVPIVSGTRRPTILLPVAAREWPAERRDAVLLHEMAHVRRLDLMTARVTQLASTLYWFNPIVWLAARAQRSEAEHACDDQVLDAGGRASTYASDLLEIARAIGGRGSLDTASLAMARRSQLEGRLLAILDPRLRRGGAGRVTVLVAVLVGVGAIGAIAAGRPARNERVAQVEAAVAEDQVVAAVPTVNAEPTQIAARADGKPAAASKTRVVDGVQGSFTDHDGSVRIGNWNHRDSRGTLLVSRGTVRYSADLNDIESISPGGWVKIEDKRSGTWHKATFKGRAGGIERTYQVDGSEQPWNASARAWLAEFLIDLDRSSGTFVEERFPRLMKEGGPERVLREVSLMTSDYGRGLYFRKLFASGLDEAVTRRAVAQAGREIESDYELTQTLIDAAGHHALEDAATHASYLEAANTLESDYEHGRALMALVERRELSPALVDGAIASATKMESDYEQAQVMIALAEKGHVKAQAQRSFIRATQGLDSDYERGRVLSALLNGDRLTGENVGEMLLATARFASDYERANVLVQLAGSVPMTAAQRTAFVESTRGMSSDHDRQRALAALAGTLSR